MLFLVTGGQREGEVHCHTEAESGWSLRRSLLTVATARPGVCREAEVLKLNV